MSVHAVIMAGGKGTRFWPLSRNRLPKQFLTILGKKSLLSHTIRRLGSLVPRSQLWVVGNLDCEKAITKDTRGVNPEHILLEPMGRNTAPCIGWAAKSILNKDPNGIMIVLPSDHFIHNHSVFRKQLKSAISVVSRQDVLITLGIVPSFPHTGYGYIEVDHPNALARVTAFHEKPSLDMAQQYVNSGRYFWNSGMFVWRAQTIYDLIQKYLPNTGKQIDRLVSIDPADREAQRAIFSKMENISIDYAVMEKAVSQIRLIPSLFDWSDIGSWSALRGLWPNDPTENAVNGDVLALNSHQNVVHSPDKLVALIDVNQLMVINSHDALLIAPLSSDQKIRDLYDQLPKSYQ